MNVWDTKPTHMLSEGEMMQYISHMEATDGFRRELQAEEVLKLALENYAHQVKADDAHTGYWDPCRVVIHFPFPRVGTYQLNLPVSPVMMHGEIVVRLYPWMTNDQRRLVARLQIEEQLDELLAAQ